MKTLPEILTTNGYIKSHLFKVKGAAADLWQAEITMQLTEEATDAIAKELMGIIGEDEEPKFTPELGESTLPEHTLYKLDKIEAIQTRNKLRSAQRARLTAFIGKEKS